MDQTEILDIVAAAAAVIVASTAIVLIVHRLFVRIGRANKEQPSAFTMGTTGTQLPHEPSQLFEACEVCGAEATHYGVVTGRTLFDRVPWFSKQNQLYGMPWRYTVVDDYTRGRRLCAIHHTRAVQRLEQAHAQMRNDHAQFNAQQHEKIAMLDQGLIELVKEDQEAIKRTIGLRGAVRRSIAPLRIVEHDEDAVVQLPTISAGKGDNEV